MWVGSPDGAGTVGRGDGRFDAAAARDAEVVLSCCRLGDEASLREAVQRLERVRLERPDAAYVLVATCLGAPMPPREWPLLERRATSLSAASRVVDALDDDDVQALFHETGPGAPSPDPAQDKVAGDLEGAPLDAGGADLEARRRLEVAGYVACLCAILLALSW